MWFKNLRIYQLMNSFELSPEELSDMLSKAEFTPCGKLDPSKTGFVSPLGSNGKMFTHAVAGYIMVAMKREEKILPVAAIKELLDKKVTQISNEECRHISKKERSTLKDEIIFEMMPKAFTKSKTYYAYFDLKAKLLVIDSPTAIAAESLITGIRNAIGGLHCIPLTPKLIPSRVMTGWIQQHLNDGMRLPESIALGSSCDLSAPKDLRAVKCRNQDLISSEIINHIDSGMVVNKIGLIWRESVDFTLDDQCGIKGLKFGDSVAERAQVEMANSPDQAFDTAFAVMTIELSGLIADVLAALGGHAGEQEEIKFNKTGGKKNG